MDAHEKFEAAMALDKIKNRHTHRMEILILRDGEGANNPSREEKYKNYPETQRMKVVTQTNSVIQQFSSKLCQKLQQLQLGEVGVLFQPKGLALDTVINNLFDNGTFFVIQLKRSLLPNEIPASVLFMNPITSPAEMQEYCDMPVKELEEFIKSRDAMCKLYERLCIPSAEIQEIEQRMVDRKSVTKKEEEMYERWHDEFPTRINKFKKIVSENQNKGLIFNPKEVAMTKQRGHTARLEKEQW